MYLKNRFLDLTGIESVKYEREGYIDLDDYVS